MSWFDEEIRGGSRNRERDQTGKVKWAVGDCIPQFATGENALLLECGESGFFLYVFLESWDEYTLSQMEPDKEVLLNWAEIGGIGFLCAKFGELPWRDAPFHPAIFKNRNRKLSFAPAGMKGIPITVVCVDSRVGKLMKIRLIGLPQKYSTAWSQWLLKASGEKLTDEEYKNKVSVVFNQYSASQLADMSYLRYSVINKKADHAEEGNFDVE